MDIKKALLVNSFRELLTITDWISHNNKTTKTSYWYLRKRDQNEYKLYKSYYRYTTTNTQDSQDKIHFLHGKYLAKLLCKPKDWVATENKLTVVTVKQSDFVNLSGL